MSDITLQNYLAKLEDFLQQQHNDEVVQHSRHILRTFPRNVAAFRLLGSALLAGGRYEDAERALRRVLRIYPADSSAHLGLSRIAESRQDGAAMIWHLERAYEQDPTNTRIQDAMRDAYRQHRRTELSRMPLTARLIASQLIRSGLYPKAISTLRTALTQLPTRIDLQVLLIQALWEADYAVEAGEAALQILKTLPESLEANEIMTRLWLREGRPSDAQRYLSRIEAVDPLYAFEVAQGTPAPNNIFRLTEFDYQREANRQLVSDSPDWLDSLGSVPDTTNEDPDDFSLTEASDSPATSDEDWLAAAFALDDDGDTDAVAQGDEDWDAAFKPPLQEAQPTVEANNEVNNEAEAVSDDDRAWIDMLNEVQSDAASPTRQVSADDFLSADQDLDQFLDDVDQIWLSPNESDQVGEDPAGSAAPPARTGLTGLLSSLDVPSSGSTGLTGLLDSLDASTKDSADELSTDELAPGSKADDWMRDVNKPTARLDLPAGVVVDDSASAAARADELEPLDESLSWLPSDSEEAVELPAAPAYDPDDSLAWMRSSGIEFLENAPASAYDAAVAAEASEPQGPLVDPHIDNPLAWARGLGVEFVDADSADDVSSALLADTTRADTEPDTHASEPGDTDQDPFAWTRTSGIEWLDDDAQPITADNLRGTDARSAASLPDNDTDYFGSQGSQQTIPTNADIPMPWGTQDRLTFTEQDGQGAMNDENNDRTPNWLSSSNNDSSSDDDFDTDDFSGDDFEKDLFGTNDPATEEDSLDWLNLLEDDQDEAATAATTDASSRSMTDPLADEFAELDRVLGLDPAPDHQSEANLPDWLLSSRPTQIPASDASDQANFDESSLDDDLEMAWGSENDLGIIEADEADTDDESETMPDWLASLAPAASTAADNLDSLFGEDTSASGSDDDLELDWEAEFDSADNTYAPTSAATPSAMEMGFDDEASDLEDELADEDAAMPDWLSALNASPDPNRQSSDFEMALDDFEINNAFSTEAEESAAENPLFAIDQMPGSDMTGDDAGLADHDAFTRSQFEAATGEPDSAFALSEDDGRSGLPFDRVDDEARFDFNTQFDLEDDLLSRAASSGDQAVAGDDHLPDWLLEIRDDESIADEAPVEAVPGWLQNAAPPQADSDSLEDDLVWELEDEDAAAPVMETPAWLSGISAETDADENDEAEAFEFDSMSAGQSDAIADFGQFEIAEDEQEAQEAQPSWLASLDQNEDILAPAPITDLDAARDTSGDFDLEEDERYVLDADELEMQLPDNTVADGDTLSRELDWMLEDEEEEPEFVAQFGDLPRLDASDEEEEAFSLDAEMDDEADLVGADISAGYSDFDPDADDDSLRGLDLSEEVEAVPASNAPDWLNAMVPGLDLDYEVEADAEEFSDEIFAADNEPVATENISGNYGWLTEIVEEELRPPVTMPEPVRPTTETAAVPTTGREERRPRFTFDRAPLWLRRLRGEESADESSRDARPTDDRFGDAAQAGIAGAGAGLMLDDLDLDDSEIDSFDEDLFDDEVFNRADADIADAGIARDDLDDLDLDEFSVDERGLDDFDSDYNSDYGSRSFGTSADTSFDEDLDLDDDLALDDDDDETDLPPWLRLDGDD